MSLDYIHNININKSILYCIVLFLNTCNYTVSGIENIIQSSSFKLLYFYVILSLGSISSKVYYIIAQVLIFKGYRIIDSVYLWHISDSTNLIDHGSFSGIYRGRLCLFSTMVSGYEKYYHVHKLYKLTVKIRNHIKNTTVGR